MVMWASLVILLTMVAHAFGVVITKKLKECNGIQISYHLGLMCVFLISPMVPYGFRDPLYVIPTMP